VIILAYSDHDIHVFVEKIAAAVAAILIPAMEAKMSALDDAITQLQSDVANLTTVDQSAMALITGFATQLAAAVAAAAAAGASPAQLQSLTDLHTAIVAQDTSLAAAVAAGTPPVPAPTPTP
jgi:ABC-type transporter Mla MlaB component